MPTGSMPYWSKPTGLGGITSAEGGRNDQETPSFIAGQYPCRASSSFGLRRRRRQRHRNVRTFRTSPGPGRDTSPDCAAGGERDGLGGGSGGARAGGGCLQPVGCVGSPEPDTGCHDDGG